jgi:hypothetical protein
LNHFDSSDVSPADGATSKLGGTVAAETSMTARYKFDGCDGIKAQRAGIFRDTELSQFFEKEMSW